MPKEAFFGPDPGTGARVIKLENHDEAYRIWRAAGIKDRTLVHLDAHDDLWHIREESELTIASFLSLALKNGIINRIFWVVPDLTWESSKSIRSLVRQLKKIIKSYPGRPSVFTVHPSRISTYLLGRSLEVCTLENLPRLEEPVLLDIDTDYLMIPRAGGNEAPPIDLPWCWPQELAVRLQAGGLRFDLATVAYSVEGGYTPLKWKHLGDEIALRLQGSEADPPRLLGMSALQAAALAARQGDLASAVESCRRAREFLPDSPAPEFHLALLCLDAGQSQPARDHYGRARALDPSYGTPYRHAGFNYYRTGSLVQAEQEFRRGLVLDPGDAYAYLGLGQIAARRKRWTEAVRCLRQSLELNDRLIDSHRTLANILARQGRRPEAIRLYERSLKLALAGQKPVTDIIATDPGLLDPQHFSTHGRLARLYQMEGETAKAVNFYRLSIAKGGGFWPRSRLAHLYLKQGQWQQSAQEAAAALMMIPGELHGAGKKVWRRLRRVLRGHLTSGSY